MINLNTMKNPVFISDLIKTAFVNRHPAHLSAQQWATMQDKRRKRSDIEAHAGETAIKMTRSIAEGGGAKGVMRTGGRSLLTDILTHMV